MGHHAEGRCGCAYFGRAPPGHSKVTGHSPIRYQHELSSFCPCSCYRLARASRPEFYDCEILPAITDRPRRSRCLQAHTFAKSLCQWPLAQHRGAGPSRLAAHVANVSGRAERADPPPNGTSGFMSLFKGARDVRLDGVRSPPASKRAFGQRDQLSARLKPAVVVVNVVLLCIVSGAQQKAEACFDLSTSSGCQSLRLASGAYRAGVGLALGGYRFQPLA
jgi:hypothetical protein